MKNRMTRAGWSLALALVLTPASVGAQDAPAAATSPPEPPAQKLQEMLKEQLAGDEEARAAQRRIDAIDDEALKLLSEYRRAQADAESYATYARQLELQIQAQEQEMAEIDVQLLEIETTSREVLPLMQRMLDTLEQFVALDVPFLLEERRNRVSNLKTVMTRADVTISEKYRRIVEAYQVELDYGRTIEAYEARLGDGADARTVHFLRVGRIALLYQTLDGRETGYWDADKKDWVVDDAYRHGFKEGIAVAKKLRAPEMLDVPVPAPKEVKS
jgi:hypothetical protein